MDEDSTQESYGNINVGDIIEIVHGKRKGTKGTIESISHNGTAIVLFENGEKSTFDLNNFIEDNSR